MKQSPLNNNPSTLKGSKKPTNNIKSVTQSGNRNNKKQSGRSDHNASINDLL
jgi:hypothetical protein